MDNIDFAGKDRTSVSKYKTGRLIEVSKTVVERAYYHI
jgi:hypothetical protein